MPLPQRISVILLLLATFIMPVLSSAQVVDEYFSQDNPASQMVTIVRARKSTASTFVEYGRQTLYMDKNQIHIRSVLLKPDLCPKSDLEILTFNLNFADEKAVEWHEGPRFNYRSGFTYNCDKKILVNYLNYLYTFADIFPSSAVYAINHPQDFAISKEANFVKIVSQNPTEITNKESAQMATWIKSFVLKTGSPMTLLSIELHAASANEEKATGDLLKIQFEYKVTPLDARKWSRPPNKITISSSNPLLGRMVFL